jgi:hypothetical protein
MALAQVARDLYEEQVRLIRAAVQALLGIWGELDPARLNASWVQRQVGPRMELSLSRAQELAAVAADTYTSLILGAQGIDITPEAGPIPLSLAGVASDGRDLAGLLLQPLITSQAAVAAGAPPREAKAAGAAALTRIVGTQVADAGRAATSLGIAVRPRVGWVRLVEPGACSRCVILAGRFYRWSDGFLRHPLCKCRNIPAAEDLDELRPDNDPMSHFNSLSEVEQNRQFTKAGAQAIREGADISRVVNARRKAMGLSVAGQRIRATAEATSSRAGLGLNGAPRLMPEEIFRQAKNREDALRLLAHHGFIR